MSNVLQKSFNITKVRTNKPVTVSKWRHFRSGGIIGKGVFSHNHDGGNAKTYEGTFPLNEGVQLVITNLTDMPPVSQSANGNMGTSSLVVILRRGCFPIMWEIGRLTIGDVGNRKAYDRGCGK